MNRDCYRVHRTRQTGFTLVEFIVATAVLAIMSGVAYAGWFNVNRIANISQQTVDRYDDLQRTFYWFSQDFEQIVQRDSICLLYTSPSPRDLSTSRMPSSA